jgi:hypothetical protein
VSRGDDRQQLLKSTDDDRISDDQPLPAHGSAPSSIHSVSTHEASDNSYSDDSHASLSILESISGRTRDRVLAANVRTDSHVPGREHHPSEEDVRGGNVLADLGLDCLDETIQSLLDTKTPMLPLRVRSNIDGRQVAGGRTVPDSCSNGNRTVTSGNDTDATPVLVRNTIRNNRLQTASDNLRAENDSLSRNAAEIRGHSTARSAVADAGVKTDGGLQRPAAAEGQRTVESLADLDSLIARYRNLRSSSTDGKAGQSASSVDQNSNLKDRSLSSPSSKNRATTATLPFVGSVRDSPALVDDANQRETRAADYQMKSASLDFVATLNLSAECGLDNDEFEDIRPNLLNISLDDEFAASANPHLHPQG